MTRPMTPGEIARDLRLAAADKIRRRGELDADHRLAGGLVARLSRASGEDSYVLTLRSAREGETRVIRLTATMGVLIAEGGEVLGDRS